MAKPEPADILDSFKKHSKIEHSRDDDYIEEVILPAAIGVVVRKTDITDGSDDENGDPTTDDWEDGAALLTVFRIAAAMYESREVTISIEAFRDELIALWRPFA